MDYVMLWFILVGGAGGYIPPMEVRAPLCGQVGPAVGLAVDRDVNPQAAIWPDPQVPGLHCRVDIRERVAGLAPGEYHLATTEIGKLYPFGTAPESYIHVDPHTSEDWVRQVGGNEPRKPATFRVVIPPQ